MRRKLAVLTLAVLLMLGIAAAALGANENFAPCHHYVASQLVVRICQYPGSLEFDKNRALDVVAVLAAAFKIDEPMYVTVLMMSPGDLGPRVAGFYDPVTKVVLISSNEILKEDYRLYYVFAHEVTHVILDLRGMDISNQHCLIYTGPEMKAVEQMLVVWGSTGRFYDPFRAIMSCMGPGPEYKPVG